ncbi:hypothetical protein C2E23DRAFT_862460 [Lenzites betulinus]|nr:hypothetical protein C2E23DRAFT_862460 [Lenzites betulinus]
MPPPPPQRTRKCPPTDSSTSRSGSTIPIFARGESSNAERLVLTLVLTITQPPTPDATSTESPTSAVMMSELSRETLPTSAPQSPAEDCPLPETTIVSSSSESPSIALRSAIVGAGAAVLGIALFAGLFYVLRRYHRKRQSVLKRSCKPEAYIARTPTFCSRGLTSSTRTTTPSLPSSSATPCTLDLTSTNRRYDLDERPPPSYSEVGIRPPTNAQPKRARTVVENVRRSQYPSIDLREEWGVAV